jgi:hypothetical protein
MCAWRVWSVSGAARSAAAASSGVGPAGAAEDLLVLLLERPGRVRALS